MRGWAAYYTPASVAVRQKARKAFEQALDLDPQSAGARVGIATVLVDDLVLGFSSSREQDKARADRLLTEALQRDINNSMAHLQRACFAAFRIDWTIPGSSSQQQ